MDICQQYLSREGTINCVSSTHGVVFVSCRDIHHCVIQHIFQNNDLRHDTDQVRVVDLAAIGCN